MNMIIICNAEDCKWNEMDKCSMPVGLIEIYQETIPQINAETKGIPYCKDYEER